MKKYRSLINVDFLRVIVLTFVIAKVVGWYLERDINARKALLLIRQSEQSHPGPVTDTVSPLVGHPVELKNRTHNKTEDVQ
jgi:hypothetical protein